MGDFERTVIIGTSCSGKTTLARTLAARLAYPHIEMDSIRWLANWTPMADTLFRRRVAEAMAAERWVLDGNYSAVRDIVWPRATTLIWLNYPFRIVAWRALTRTLRRSVTREELWAGNRESLRLAFLSRDSILLWVLKTYWRRQRTYPLLFREPQHQHLEVITLRHPRQADVLIADIERGRSDAAPPMSG